MSDWFAAHKEGLRQIAERLVERRGFGIIGGELYQNIMDTTATRCSIDIEKIPNTPRAKLEVFDNGEGFADLSHAWTLFAPSAKKQDPTKAGRFNVGEKMFLAFCREATIRTTSGSVIFDEEEGRVEKPRAKLVSGTQISAVINCTNERLDQFLAYMQRIIVRPGLKLVVNGEEIPRRQSIASFAEVLRTEVANDEGDLRPTSRKAEVELYEVLDGEVGMLYELGIPVVETEDKWHYNVLQKVPLNVDRDNVTPSYLTALRTFVFNHMHHQISEEDTEASWVNEASSDERCSPDAAKSFLTKKYGDRSVTLDPFNPEANGEAMSRGYTVIPNHGLTRGQRENLYRGGMLQSSTTAFPLAGKGAYSDDPNATPVEVIPEEKWSAGMHQIWTYTNGVAQRLLGKKIDVQFVNCRSFVGEPWGACYGRGHLFGLSGFHYNVARLGRKWFDHGSTEAVDKLILHELGHEFEGNHLSYQFQDALCRLGAALKAAVMREPAWFAQFVK